jgi:hypothetical protein
MDRLKGLLEGRYEFKLDEYYNLTIYVVKKTEVEKKTLFKKLMVMTWDKKEVVEIRHMYELNMITVYDEKVYPLIKQFGDEFGYRCLQKDWPGAEDQEGTHAPSKKQKRKMEEETLGPRYERMVKEK